MPLYEALKRRGYTFRRHLPEEGWTQRALTVVDLTEAQRAALDEGGEDRLRDAVAGDGVWTFPAMAIPAPLPAVRDLVLADDSGARALVAAPRSEACLWGMAERFVSEVRDRFGVSLDLVDDANLGFEALADGNLVVFGGGHDSALARDLALRFQTFFIDAVVPGDDGWVVTTHSGLDASGHSVLQVWAGVEGADAATDCLLADLEGGDGRLSIRRLHRIHQGSDMRDRFPSWESFSRGLPMGLPEHVGGPQPGSTDPAMLAAQVSRGLDSGGPDVNHYNPGPIDTAISSGWYYLLSADARALSLFRELLFGIADYYLKTPEGASYPADLDFRSGHLVLYWSRLEHEPVFDDEDRLILSNLLLAMTRSTHEYASKMWPVEPNGRTRHNHETFPARSLMYGADYFRRYNVPWADDWRVYADTVFSGGLWTRVKQRENANHYEQTAYEHASCYSGYTGNRLALFGDGVLRQAAMRHVATTDNFLRGVDYSDAGASLGPAGSDMLAQLATCDAPSPELQWYARQIFLRGRQYLGSPRDGIQGLRRADPGLPPPVRCWEKVELEPQFIEDFAPGFPSRHAFDKLAYRTGWGDDDQYLLLEGVGGRQISHAHNEVNAVVRYNHLGRHWVVSNGYGRRTGLTNVRDSFSSRVLGPEDHNMLVLSRAGEVVDALPACAALLQWHGTGDLAVSTGALLGYGGTNWLRTVVVAADRFLLVIDRVQVLEDGLESGHLEWNALGELEQRATGCRLDQRGVFLDVSSPSGWEVSFGESDRSADWQRVLHGDAYPYADFPLKKVVYRMPTPAVGGHLCLATLLAATPEPAPRYRVEAEGALQFVVESEARDFREEAIEEDGLTLRTSGHALKLSLADDPSLPSDLDAWSAH